jgi:hypothetical protein
MAQLYADEDFPFPVVERLRQFGHDVVTTLEAGRANQELPDVDQLAFATSLGRAVLTRNRRHFISLHRRFPQHAGIVSITDDPDFEGQADRIHQALSSGTTLGGQHVRVNRPNPSSKP